ncbi:hypothetical protein E9993_06910 [Labilibacter sediminis]|nr:hypothetical protein E9993_06910 [Labilibacter sediminis]
MNDIFIFNPTGEMAIANGMVSYMPPKKLRTFEEDLSFLPSFYAQKGDIIITPQKPDESFLKKWQTLGLPSLKFQTLSECKLNTQYNYLRPWSWNKAIHHKFKEIKPHASDLFKQSPNYKWDADHKDFFSRQTTNKIQKHLRQQNIANNPVKIESEAICIHSIQEFDKWMNTQSSAILKMPWSSSGRGIHTIDPANNFPINYPWLRGALKQQGYVTAEPLLNKKFDFSFQLMLEANGEINLSGISYFINDDKGHFTGGHIKWPHRQNKTSAFLNNDVLNTAATHLIEAIKTVNPQRFYEGPIGVDAIVYENKNSDLKIHPCVDINWRYNMGIVNISLPKFLDDDSIGVWKVGAFESGKWNSFIEQNEKEKPLILNNSKIISGFVPMTPPNANAHFGVWMEVWQKQ